MKQRKEFVQIGSMEFLLLEPMPTHVSEYKEMFGETAKVFRVFDMQEERVRVLVPVGKKEVSIGSPIDFMVREK